MSSLPEWIPPWPATGTPTFERLSSAHLRPGACPEQVAKKARPDVWPISDPADYIPSLRGNFPLGLVRDAVLALLMAGNNAEAGVDPDAQIHAAVDAAAFATEDSWPPVTVRLARDAVAGYLTVRQQLLDSGELLASHVFSELIVRYDGHIPLELYSWGVFHIADDGAVRELHLLRWQQADAVDLAAPSLAVAAHVTAAGFIAQGGSHKWSQPFTAASFSPPRPADIVRVRVIGVLDHTQSLRFDGTVDDARRAYDADASPASAVLAGGAFRLGRGCAQCSVRQQCPAIPRRPGLLGCTGYSESTRSLTPSDLTAYRLCPTRPYLQRDLGLPSKLYAAGPAQTRGRNVHAWLARAHARGVRCSLTDVPDVASGSGLGLLAAELGWNEEDYAECRPYLVSHLEHCPIGANVVDAYSELSLVAWDTDSNIVVSTRPDLQYRTDDGVTHLRETKTLNHPRLLPDEEWQLLDHFPQVALSICLLADDPAIREGEVELELLGEEFATLVTYDASDDALVLDARTALANVADAWLHDVVHAPSVRPPCSWCPMRSVCPHVDPTTRVADVEDIGALTLALTRAWGSADVAAAIDRLEPLAGGDEDFPF